MQLGISSKSIYVNYQTRRPGDIRGPEIANKVVFQRCGKTIFRLRDIQWPCSMCFWAPDVSGATQICISLSKDSMLVSKLFQRKQHIINFITHL
jgi:hypothetical protein